MFLIIAVGLVVAAIGYYFLLKPYKFWAKKGVKQGRPYPIVGDNLGTLLRTQSFSEFVEHVYKMWPDNRYSGIYQFSMPTLVLRDPDLIKQITVKDFENFADHMNFLPEDIDQLWTRNLFALKGQKWRDMRSTLSPAFTSSKMKTMFGLMDECAQNFSEYFLNENKDVIEIEMKETFARFTTDVIASCAFGIQCNSFNEPNNDFYVMGKDITDSTSVWKAIKVLMIFMMPKFFAYFGIHLFDAKVTEFFTTLVKNNVEERGKHGIIRPDMIHLLMEARKQGGLKYDESQSIKDTGFATIEESDIGKTSPSKKTPITEIDMTAQAMIFFFAGFDSVSSFMCFMSYELGINPDIQQKLRDEVDETLKACGGKITYDALLGMKYMDMVISETLRMWPTAAATDRLCNKSYTIQPTQPDEKPVTLEKGDIVWLPIFGLHRDPKFFPEPTRFDPERFSDENKNKIRPYSYLPFGSGPRACIGSRFALLEIKTIYFYLLLHFEVVPIERTKIPLRLNRKSFSMTAEGGFWFGLKRRSVK